MLIYICHEYGGKEANKYNVGLIIKGLIAKYPEHTFISPHSTFGFMYHDVDYEQGMKYCLDLLRRCDEMWTFGDKSDSRGCQIEKAYCVANKIRVVDKESEL